MEKREKRDLRHKRIRVELDGQVKEYASIKEFVDTEGFALSTVMGWLRGTFKPRIDIKINYV